MTDLREYFLANARLSRRAFADFVRADRTDVDDLADDLDLGERLTLEEAQELMLELDDTADDDDDEEADNDDLEENQSEEE
jgi:hypothetical protein